MNYIYMHNNLLNSGKLFGFITNYSYMNPYETDTDYQEFLLMVTTPETIKRDQYITDYHDAMSC